ncbi:MAG: prokaryotic membrane lipolipid attachment site family protein [Neisseria sp.]|nr:prokaryotic membrane lipolipid attachment site family protein [Neisseria sp.]
MKIKTLLAFSCAAVLLAGCASPFQASRYGKLPGTEIKPVTTPAYQLAPQHWADVDKIREEAKRLSIEVGNGTMTKVQAAQYLDRYRIALVGHNPVDDNVYQVYLRSAVDSQAGKISAAQSKQLIQTALSVWHQSWPTMGANKPTNPAFTNFLMGVMGMPALQ